MNILRRNLPKFILITVIVIGVILAAAVVLGSGRGTFDPLAEDKLSRIRGVRQLQQRGFNCDPIEIVDSVYYDATCVLDSDNGRAQYLREVENRNSVHPYTLDSPWVWNDNSGLPFIHAASRYSGGFGSISGTSTAIYSVATGPFVIKDSGYIWVIPSFEGEIAPGASGPIISPQIKFSEADASDWVYIGPFYDPLSIDDTPCNSRYRRNIGQNHEVFKLYPQMIHNMSNQSFSSSKKSHDKTAWRAKFSLSHRTESVDAYGLDPWYCVRSVYKSEPSTETDDLQYKWIKFTIPVAKIDQATHQYSEDQADKLDIKIRVHTFDSEDAKRAYYVRRTTRHPCRQNAPFVIEGKQFLAWSESDKLTSLAAHEYLAEWLGSYRIFADDQIDEDDQVSILSKEDCQNTLAGLTSQAERCRNDHTIRHRPQCRWGADNKLLDMINPIAERCQDMYNTAKQRHDDYIKSNPESEAQKASLSGAPTASEFAECLGLKDTIKDDFINSLSIGHDCNCMRFTDKIPRIKWLGKTEVSVSYHLSNDVRLRMELVALHEYMHSLYYVSMPPRERIRFTQEVMKLIVSDEERMGYDGKISLRNLIRNQIVRHGHTNLGLISIENIIEDLSRPVIKKAILAEIPEDVQQEYQEFIRDKHGFVAFVYEIALAANNYDHRQKFYYHEPDNVLSGLDDFIYGDELNKILNAFPSGKFAWNDFNFILANSGLSQSKKVDAANEGSEEAWQLMIKIGDLFSANLEEAGFLANYREDYPKTVNYLLNTAKLSLMDDLISLFTDYEILSGEWSNGDKTAFLDELVQIIISTSNDFGDKIPASAWQKAEAGLEVSGKGLVSHKFNGLIQSIRSDIRSELGNQADNDIPRQSTDISLFALFHTMERLLSETYPILGLETDDELSEWLNEHYNQYFDRKALTSYFKYNPKLKFGSED